MKRMVWRIMGIIGRWGRMVGWGTAGMMVLISGVARSEDAVPQLRYIEEYTNTRNVRDIAVFAGKVWTGTEGGISVYDQKNGSFLFKLTSRVGLFGNSIRRIVPTAKGTLLVGGDFGTAEITAECTAANKTCFSSVRPFSAKGFNPVMDIVQSENETLLLGHQSGLLDASNSEKKQAAMTGMWRAAAHDKSGMLIGGMDGRLMLKKNTLSAPSQILRLDKPVLQIAPVPDGFLVLAGTGLWLMENKRIKPVLFGSKSMAVTALARDGAQMLIGGTEGEIFEYDHGALRRIGKTDGRVTAVLDDGAVIWVGIADKGLFRYSRKQKTALPAPGAPGEICSNHVTRMTQFQGQQVAGTFDNGACILVEGNWQMLDGMAGQYVHGVAGDGKYLWVATSNGIARYDGNLQPVPLNDDDPKELRWFTASAVTALAETANGVALGSPWGVVRVTRAEKSLSAEFISRFRGAPKQLTSIVQTENGLFVSSESEGVRFVGKKRKDTRVYLDPVHLPEAWILDVSAADSGFWAAACQNGVSFVDGERATFINASKGLADNRTVGVAAYGKGAFVATLAGLSYAEIAGSAASPFNDFLPDPRGTMAAVQGNALYYGTESGTAVFEIGP